MRSINSRLPMLPAFATLCLFTGLFTAACDPNRFAGPTAEANDVTFTFVRAAAEGHPGTYTISGLVTDRGTYVEKIVLGGPRGAPTTLYGARILTSPRGRVAIQLSGLATRDRLRVQGQFTLSGGTGSYAALTGSGTFEMPLPVDGASIEAIQTLAVRSIGR